MKKNLIAKMLLIGALICTMCVPAGCSNKTADMAAAADGYYEETNAVEYVTQDYGYIESDKGETADVAEDTTVTGESITTNRKLIKNVQLDVETENFTEFIESVETQIKSLGGYVADSYTYNGSKYSGGKVVRRAEIEIRIPEKRLDTFMGEVGNICNVIEKTMTTEDVTLQYVDTEGKKKMYLAEEQSLLALLEKAETLEDITYLTSRLSEVRYQIENTESRLRTYDNLVDYATVVIMVNEVEVLTEQKVEKLGFWEELGSDFMDSIQDVANFFVSLFCVIVVSLPYLLTIAAVVAVFILAIKLIIAIMKKKNNRKNSKVTEESK